MATQTVQEISPMQKAAAENSVQLQITSNELQQTLRLAGLLQTSLELDSVLNFFLEATTNVVDFEGAQFKNRELEYSFQFGKMERHTCSYRLRLADELLGELTFSRKRRFSQPDILQLENLLTQALYPIRNAIMYKRAIIASQVDPLTGINNRMAFDNTIIREVERSHRHNLPLSLLVIDLDHFKTINDTLGHSAGDAILRTLTGCIGDTLRSTDTLYRYGGEEFVVILAGTQDDGAALVAERLRTEIAQYPFTYNDSKLKITASIGVASLSKRDDAKRLFNKADAALYQAKNAGRNQVYYYSKSRNIQN